jgi:uncharacterized protein (TIGR01777 family)
MVIALTGGTGLVGKHLKMVAEGAGHSVVPIKRMGGPASPHWSTTDAAIRKPDAVVHLAGENIASKRWTPAQKERIRESRVIGTARLCDKIVKMEHPPRVLACASAVGFYGDRGEDWLDEESERGDGFLAEVCAEWEQAATSLIGCGIRVVNLRFGMILDGAEGALGRLIPLFSSGLGGPLGEGTQWMSWISSSDAARAILFCLEQHALDGPVNVVSPSPVRNKDFSEILAGDLGSKVRFRIPKMALNLGLGEMGQELLLSSTRVRPAKLEQTGFPFDHPTLDSALHAILHPDGRPDANG